MGGCTSNDLYRQIKKQHGQLFEKFIVDSQSLIRFKRKIKSSIQQYDTKSEQKRQNLHAQVNQRQQMMMYHLNETKLKIDNQIPSGLNNYQQMKKIKIDNQLGLPQYKNRFNAIHQHIDKEVNQRKNTVHKQLEDIARKAQEEYKIDPQKMNLYHQMSQQQRAYVRQKGIKEFSHLVDKRMIELEKRNPDELNIQSQLKKLDSILSLEQIDHLGSIAKNKFNNQALNIVGGHVDSQIRV